MKKNLLITGIVLVAIFILYNILGQSGIFKVFHNPTTANEPNLKMDTYFVTTNLLTPTNGDFISYMQNDEILGLHYRLHRLCGIEGDIVELKKGILYINGESFDEKINLIHYYKISEKNYKNLPKSELENEYNYPSKINDTTYQLLLNDELARKNGLSENKFILEKEEIDNSIQEAYNKNWNKDNFGPLIIPKGKAFVLGDNRDNSEDSRYFGLIELKNIKGKIIIH
jgi:signal peptidase I